MKEKPKNRAPRIKICRINVCDFNDLKEFKYGIFIFTWLKLQVVLQYEYIQNILFQIKIVLRKENLSMPSKIRFILY
jgi:hypothetical protein